MNHQLALPFMWRTRHGEYLQTSEMQTRHVFHVVRMLWNHSAPEHLKLYPHHKWSFGASYTPAYVKEAVRAMFLELSNRNDLEEWMIRDIEHMRAVFSKALPESPKLLETASE